MKTILFLLAGGWWLTLIGQAEVSVTRFSGVAVAVQDTFDAETGLVIDSQLMLVKAQCTACHSSKLILQNRFTREGWKEKIRWMQRTQKLWDLGETEPVVLDYLAKHYGPQPRSFDGRRLPLTGVNWHE